MTHSTPKSDRHVVYYRVSTKAQGQSGLGLEAQKAAVDQFLSSTGGEVLREFIEVESGKNADRQELKAAISYARRCKATLLVAKLDRLSRNVAFLATLMEGGVEFRACDNPHATPFTIHILAAVAEYEREMISKRTKEALAAAKARGVALGSHRRGHWKGREDRRLIGGQRGAERAAIAHKKSADIAYEDVMPMIMVMKNQGLGFNTIARRLNEDGIPSRRGRRWYGTTVRNVISRKMGS